MAFGWSPAGWNGATTLNAWPRDGPTFPVDGPEGSLGDVGAAIRGWYPPALRSPGPPAVRDSPVLGPAADPTHLCTRLRTFQRVDPGPCQVHLVGELLEVPAVVHEQVGPLQPLGARGLP